MDDLVSLTINSSTSDSSLCSLSFALASMFIVRINRFPNANDTCLLNGLRYLAFLITLACFTWTLSVFQFSLVFGTCSECKVMMMDQRICCVNCNICVNSVNTQNSYLVLEQKTRVISVLCNWISPVIITEEDYICEECFQSAVQTVNQQLHGENESDQIASPSPRGHRKVCVACGRSLANRQSHLILNEIAHNAIFRHLVENKVAPRQISSSDCLCHACFVRTKRHALRSQGIDQQRSIDVSAIPEDTFTTADNMEVIPQEVGTSQERSLSRSPEPSHQQQFANTVLRNYKRAPNTSSHCIFYD